MGGGCMDLGTSAGPLNSNGTSENATRGLFESLGGGRLGVSLRSNRGLFLGSRCVSHAWCAAGFAIARADVSHGGKKKGGVGTSKNAANGGLAPNDLGVGLWK